MNRTAKLVTGVSIAVVAVGLLALTLPVVLPFLPARAQAALSGPIDTVPGTVDELFRVEGVGSYGNAADIDVSHADVDQLYVEAAKVWPWDLPAGWKFPSRRGVPDTPGTHHRGMGLQAAFSKYTVASLDAVRSGQLDPAAADHLLDEVTDAYRTLITAEVLGDHRFIEDTVDPLRSHPAADAP